MPEIRSTHTKEQIEKYAKDNQLDILNPMQIAAKFLELEDRLSIVE